MIAVQKTTKGKMTMFKIKKDLMNEPSGLFISGKEIELQYCHCHEVRYGVCKLDDLKSESGIDYPDEIHLLVTEGDNLCSDLEIYKVDSGRMLQVEYCFHEDVTDPFAFFSSFANFNLFFTSPDVLDKFKKVYNVEHCKGFVKLSRKINIEDNIYSTVRNDLIKINAILTN